MRNDFRSEECSAESSVLFDHARASDELGASIFWVRPDMLLGEPLEQFLSLLADQARRPTTRHCGDTTMIASDQELKVARERISCLLDLLARLAGQQSP